MSKSTPLNQLPQQQQPMMEMQMHDPAEQDVLQEVMKTTGEYLQPKMHPQQMMMPMQYPQQMMMPSQLSHEKIFNAFDNGDLKMFTVAVALFALASNTRVVSFISEKVPMLSGSVANLTVRAAVFAAVLVVAIKTMNKMA
jgi:hypothetical protein